MIYMITVLIIALCVAIIWGIRNRLMLDLIIQYMLENGYALPNEATLERILKKMKRRK